MGGGGGRSLEKGGRPVKGYEGTQTGKDGTEPGWEPGERLRGWVAEVFKGPGIQAARWWRHLGQDPGLQWDWSLGERSGMWRDFVRDYGADSRLGRDKCPVPDLEGRKGGRSRS